MITWFYTDNIFCLCYKTPMPILGLQLANKMKKKS